MIRLLTYLFFIFCSFQAYSESKPAENLGIAFVHGTNDHREDAATEYWKSDFVSSVAEGLKDPTNQFIVHCDFTNYMWEEAAAGCVADQLDRFITEKKLSKLVVYTHSNGGNVMRWLLSNPTYDARFMHVAKTIKQVIALAPSSGGTVLADETIDGSRFESGLAWLLGYQNNAVRQQRVSDMVTYNEEVIFGTKGRPNLPVPFRAMVGTDVVASPFVGSSYCNGYFYNASLKVSKTYLDDCSDGYLDCRSQSLAGSVWFYDWQKSEDQASINHNQSRHSCSGLDKLLRNDLLEQGVSR